MRALMLFVIGLFFGVGGGIVLSSSQNWTLDGHDHADPSHHAATDGAGHDHETLRDLPAENAPALSVEATPDTGSGWQIHLVTQNFTFAPESAGGKAVPGEGHAHLYLDGIKIGRVYGPWVHLDRTGGELRVTLNANDHRPLSVEGTPVEAVLTLSD